MTGSISSSAERQLNRLLKRTGLTPVDAPDVGQWGAFLDGTSTLLTDLGQDRYLLEQSLEASSAEMLELNAELRQSAERLAVDREELRRSNSLLEATLESTSDGIMVADGNGGITSVNGRFIELWGLPPEVVRSGSDDRALAFVLDQLKDPDAFLAKVRELYEMPEASSHDLLEFKDGRLVERDSLPQRIDGEIVGRVWSFRDVTDARRLQEELRHQAFHDSLTGLSNRALFADHVTQALRRRPRNGGFVAVIVVDLDGFKTVNDSLGHPVGDALLVEVGQRFRTALREIDTIARLGGDEFAMVVEYLDSPPSAARVGQRILDSLSTPIEIEDRLVSVTASVGIAVATDDSATSDSLLGNADTAMYRAKRDGKNCFRLFEAWMYAAALQRLELEQSLRAAVAADEIDVHYQPVVAAESGRVVSFEALARWTSPTLGAIGPDVFIPIAEECGLIIDIGRSVLRQACAQAAGWRTKYPEVMPSVAVNVSRRQLVDPLFPDEVCRALSDAGLAPSGLVLEVTESVLGSDPTQVVSVLQQIRRSGVRVAIDDFGTGYSSLAALTELPIDMLKIDKRFIDNLLIDGRGRGLVEAITQLAGSLGLETTAEGVELVAQQQGLVELGCDRIQGYLYSRPLAAADSDRYLAEVAAHHAVATSHDVVAARHG